MKLFAFLLVAVAVVCLFASQSPACDGLGGGGCYGSGYGYLYSNLDYKIPYFAAHPPVYYSYPIARTYGYSPFAYPPGTRTPEIVAAPIEPVTVINPYVEQSTADSGKRKGVGEDKVTTVRQPKPLTIWNPFVVSKATLVQVSE